jgi:hypothetical protein
MIRTIWLPELRFDRTSVKTQLDPYNQEPTSYISMYASLEKTRDECVRRMRVRLQGQVRVSRVSWLRRLKEERVFLTPVNELLRTKVLNDGVYFVEQFIVACGLLGRYHYDGRRQEPSTVWRQFVRSAMTGKT